MTKYRKSYDIRVRGVRTSSGTRLYEIREYENVGYLDAEEFARRPAEAIAGLIRTDMPFIGPKRGRLVELVAEVEEFIEAALFDRIGHNGAHFVYPDGEVFSPEGLPPATVIFEPKPEKCHQAGTLQGWLANVAGPLAGHAICEFFLMAPFAGPLRTHTTRVENFGWELIGPPATGKSVLLQLASSICGGSLGGDEGNFGLSFAATRAGVEWETQNYSDLVMIIDEGNLFELNASRTARGRSFSELLMALGKGQEKRRYGTSSRTFRFVWMTSSNETLIEVIGGTSAESVVDAVADRLMTIPLKDREFGVFDELPLTYSDIGDFIADLVNASEQHHGLAMRHYLQQVVNLAHEDVAEFRSRLDGHIAEFRHHACIEANAGSSRRVADAFGLVYAAGRLAVYSGALPASFDPLSSTLACYGLHKAAFQPDPSAASMLIALADDPDVIDLDETQLVRMSDEEVAETKAFLRTNNQRERELLIPPSSIRNLIQDWNRVRRDDFELSRLLRRDGQRHTVKRRIRSNSESDRVICVVMPHVINE